MRISDWSSDVCSSDLDHGLETPDERIAAGKQAEGVVRLSAEHRGGRILICVSDDGRGINRERVLATAVERGLIAPDAQLSDAEIDNLSFAPGFSTAQAAAKHSGRGAGLAAGPPTVQCLGGRARIQK